MKPAVVVLAYQRPSALRRLLDSLQRASFPEDVPLIFSIDRGAGPGYDGTITLARDFVWPHGPMTVIERETHLGVVAHFRAAGALSQEHDAVVLLEDDLVVAPSFYDFASAQLDAYASEERIAGCCLYGLWFNGFTHEPFLPVQDGSDVFFLQLPYTQGLCFSATQWRSFAEWWAAHPRPDVSMLHESFGRFGPDEWFPAHAAYVASTGRFFVFPRTSQTAGWGDAGAHFAAASSWFQTPLQLATRSFDLPPLDGALALYDGHFELLPDRLVRLGGPANVDLDLSATKRPSGIEHDLVLTTRPVINAISRFGLAMYPPELNAAWQVPGDDIALARREDVRWDAWSETEARRRLHDYYARHHRPSRRRDARFLLSRLVAAWRSRRRS